LCFNAVCQPTGVAEAVLVRAVEPSFGRDIMHRFRPVAKDVELTSGPSKLCIALNIDMALDGVDLCDAASSLFIARNSEVETTQRVLGPRVTTTRIGITRAADWPLRYYLDGSRYVSKRIGTRRTATAGTVTKRATGDAKLAS
jgi:DNA-3-methyladenine glycosylase